MGDKRNRGKRLDRERLRQVLLARFGTAALPKAAAELRKLLPKYAERTLIRALGGGPSDIVPQICEALDVSFEAVKKGNSGVVGPEIDRTARALELPKIQTKKDLIGVLETQEYTYGARQTLTDLLLANEDVPGALDLLAGVVMDGFSEPNDAVGLASTLIGTNLEQWRPRRSMVRELGRLCDRAMSRGVVGMVGVVEPLAFAVGFKGAMDVARRLLRLLVEDGDWRREDAKRVAAYYGNQLNEIQAYYRHQVEGYRQPYPLLRANDTSRLMHLLTVNNPVLERPDVRHAIESLVASSVDAVEEANEPKLARTARRALVSL